MVDLTDVKKVDSNGRTKTVGSKVAERKLTQFHVDDQHSVYSVWDDNRGNVYTTIYGARMVKRFTPQDKEEVVAQTSIPWAPTGGLVDHDGNLWLLGNSVTNSVRVERLGKDRKRTVFD